MILNISSNELTHSSLPDIKDILSKTKLVEFNISRNRLGNKGIKALGDLYKSHNYEIENLDISYLDFNSEGFKYFLDSFKAAANLRGINFEGNSIGDFDESLKSIYNFFQCCVNLRSISFSKCELDDEAAKILSKPLTRAR